MAVDHHCHGLFGERLGNALSQRLAGDTPRKGPLGTVGKCQGDVAHALSSHSLPTKQVRWKSSREPRNSPRASELVPLRVPPCQDGHACHVVARPAHWADVGGRTQQKRIEAQAGPAAAGAAAITNCFEGRGRRQNHFAGCEERLGSMCREGNPGATASKCGPTNSVEGSIDGYAPKHHPVTE